MIIITLLLKLFCHSLNSADDGDISNDITVFDNTIEVDRLLYGDIIKMDDLYLPTNNIDNFDDLSESYIKEEINKNNFINPIWNLDDLNLPDMNNWTDVKVFNEITKSVRNVTKNNTNLRPGPLTRRYWYQDIEDGKDEYYASKFYKETDKKNRLINLMLTFIIHARYQIKKIVKAKSSIRGSKRYRIGFLFNTLKHLHYEQTKIAGMAHLHVSYEHLDVYALVKMYEKVIRADVDIIDTITLIKAIDLEEDKWRPIRSRS